MNKWNKIDWLLRAAQSHILSLPLQALHKIISASDLKILLITITLMLANFSLVIIFKKWNKNNFLNTLKDSLILKKKTEEC